MCYKLAPVENVIVKTLSVSFDEISTCFNEQRESKDLPDFRKSPLK